MNAIPLTLRLLTVLVSIIGVDCEQATVRPVTAISTVAPRQGVPSTDAQTSKWTSPSKLGHRSVGACGDRSF